MKKIFITDYVGLSTRLEALAIAFLISERFGHQICLDWQELDALRTAMPQAQLVEGNRFGGVAAGLAYAGAAVGA